MKKMIRWTVTLAYAVGVFYLSITPSVGPQMFPFQDKVAHFIMYAGLAFLFVWALRVTVLRQRSHLPVIAALIAIAYGAFNEINQLFLSYRSAEIGDMVANIAGALVGALAGMLSARAIDARRSRTAQPIPEDKA